MSSNYSVKEQFIWTDTQNSLIWIQISNWESVMMWHSASSHVGINEYIDINRFLRISTGIIDLVFWNPKKHWHGMSSNCSVKKQSSGLILNYRFSNWCGVILKTQQSHLGSNQFTHLRIEWNLTNLYNSNSCGLILEYSFMGNQVN